MLDTWWTDEDGYKHLVRIQEGDKPSEGNIISVDLGAYGLPAKVQEIMVNAKFVTPRDYKARPGIFRTMAGALRAVGLPYQNHEAFWIINQIREDYRI